MAAFEYKALDAKGRVKHGIVSADTARLARRELRDSKLIPLQVELAAARRAMALPQWLRGSAAPRGERVPVRDITLMTRQLATLVTAAAPVEEALHTIALQAENLTLRNILLAVRGNVMEGFKLSDALAHHPRAFSPLYRALVAAGESSGNLGTVLERLADHLEKTERLRAKVLAALIYPLVLSFVAMSVVTLLMVFVVPKVVSQFDSMGQELPALTRTLIFISETVRSYGWLGIIALIGAGWAFRKAMQGSAFKRRVDAFLLRLPIAGKLLRGLHAARMARTLGTLVVSGTPVLEGLSAAAGTVQNLVIREGVTNVIAAVREGAGLSSALRRSSVFPPMVVYMAAVGENSGQLGPMLIKAAEHLENEFETVTSTAVSLLEPLIIVAMGAVVAGIVLAILLPILQLNSLALM